MKNGILLLRHPEKKPRPGDEIRVGGLETGLLSKKLSQ